jgi:D-proline reductase (dithiol) PrdB
MVLRGVTNRLLARLFTRFPRLAERWAESHDATSAGEIPWTPMTTPLAAASIALVSTAGVHLRTQPAFDMRDPDGDPTYREIPRDTPRDQLIITHDYYDHRDADRDVNIVLPLDRLAELAAAGEIGALAPRHFSFMGHIDGQHIHTLQAQSAPAVVQALRADRVDAVLLAPA